MLSFEEILEISALGLRNRNFKENSLDESIFLSPLQKMLKTRISLPRSLRDYFDSKDNKKIQDIFEEFTFYQGFQN